MGALLTGTEIDTGNIYLDAQDNVRQLLLEHPACLGVDGVPLHENLVVAYDEQKVFASPWISIVFDEMVQVDYKINNCYVLGLNMTLYSYYESLSFGNDTRPFLQQLWKITEVLLVHKGLYGFTAGSPLGISIMSSALVGRVLDSDAFLTGQTEIQVQHRICLNSHCEPCT